jgi:ATP-dependent Clp protease ATP-binding subunit ClpA
MRMRKDPALDAIHLLRGLIWRDRTRAEVLFQLREKFPQYCVGKVTLATIAASIRGAHPAITEDAKKVLGYAAREADAMGDAWVDTDHLLIGILCLPDNVAAQELTEKGIEPEAARRLVAENRSSRPDYGPITPLGQSPSFSIWLKSKWCWWKARRSERRFIVRRRR